jgi:LysM repeat protein
MLRQSNANRSNKISLLVSLLLIIVTFALIGFVTLSVVTGGGFDLAGSPANLNVTPQPATVVSAGFTGTPNPADTTAFKSPALGFALQYPKSWRKSEQALQVIFSPTAAGLAVDDLQDAAIWFGIPADNVTDPLELLAHLESGFSSANQPFNQTNALPLVVGGQSWPSKKLNFQSDTLNGPATALLAATSRDEVGYFVVAVAPAAQWNDFEPLFQSILNSYHFTTEAVLRPTDATPPPTPTATPTPVIYLVQPGDTLLQIALMYGVDVEALAARNGIEEPRSLRTGTRLIIPHQRNR